MKALHLLSPAIILILAGCSNPDYSKLIHADASLPASFNFNKMDLKVVSSSINETKSTMSTLYGNDIALQTLKNKEANQSGEVLALVTWKRQEDSHWFGAWIPGKLLAVEVIKTAPGKAAEGPEISYQRFEGSKLTLNTDTTGRVKSIRYILEQQPSVMP